MSQIHSLVYGLVDVDLHGLRILLEFFFVRKRIYTHFAWIFIVYH